MAKECRSDIEAFEANDLSEVLEIVRTEDISVLFINVSVLKNADPTAIRSMSNVRIVLVKDMHSKLIPHENFTPSAVAVIDLENNMDACKADITVILGD